MRCVWILLFFSLCIVSCSAVQIVEFCPDPYQEGDLDEYLVIAGQGSLDGVTISDNHAGFRFPASTTIDGTVTVARSGPAYKATHGKYPDFEWQNASYQVPDVVSGGILRLSNAADELRLYQDNRLVQNVSWPADVKPRQGQVHYLENGVWDTRVLMLGQSRLSSATFRNVTVTAFVSPDSSLGVFSRAVDSAQDSLLVNVYELTSTNITNSLVAAKERGVDVTVLLEGGPVGGISAGEKAAIWRLNQSGIPVYEMATGESGHAPFRYDHAKYMVIDNRSVFLTSENFGQTGFPPAGETGNRGWGVWMEDPATAAYFREVFTGDMSGPAIVAVIGTNGTAEVPSGIPYTVVFTPQTFSGAQVTPVIAPDTSSEITTMLESAKSTIEIEQAYITNESGTTLNPYLATAINASRKGVHVRVLLDSYWYNTEDEADNDEMAAVINRVAADEHLPIEARCADLSAGGFEKIHNKGVIVDDRAVLVSSINWNTNSPGFNRETGVIIEQPEAARYFRAVFDADWAPAVRSPEKSTDYLKIACLIAVIGLLVLIYYRRHVR